jgi:hypothetical protein
MTDARCRHEIKCRTDMPKAAFNRKKTLHQQFGLKFTAECSEMLRLKHWMVMELLQFGK